VPTDSENVCLSGKTGSDRRTVKVTRRTHTGSRPFRWTAAVAKYWGRKNIGGATLQERLCWAVFPRPCPHGVLSTRS